MNDQAPSSTLTRDEQLKIFLDAVAADLLNASLHNRLCIKLREAAGENNRAMNQALAFWGLVIKSQADSTMSNLCRAYDPQTDQSLGLKPLLKYIEANLELFEIESFSERLSDRGFSFKEVDRQQLIEDKFCVCRCNPLVKKITFLQGQNPCPQG